MHGWDLSSYSRRAEASGWAAIEGSTATTIESIDRAYTEAWSTSDRPTMILARTIKGFGASETANKEGKHGKPAEGSRQGRIEELGNVGPSTSMSRKPESAGFAASV